jgi:Flp pilus assembly protein TadG
MMRRRKMDFVGSESGNVAATFGLTLSLMVMFVGVGADLGRQYRVAKTVQESIDAGVLAGGRYLQDNDGDTDGAKLRARAVFDANMANLNETLTDSAPDSTTSCLPGCVSFDSDGVSMRGWGTASIATTFTRIGGYKKMPVAATSAAPTRVSREGGGLSGNLEISVMLDITGSMCDDGYGPCATGTKISGLKTAVTGLINTVVPTTPSTYTSKVALVPFSTRIRVGQDGGAFAANSMMKKLTNMDSPKTFWEQACTNATGGGGSEGDGDWNCLTWAKVQRTNWQIMPCVTDRFYNSGWSYGMTDDAPGSGKWLNAHDGSRNPYGPDSSNTAPAPLTLWPNGAPRDGDGAGTQSDPTSQWNYAQTSYCGDIDNANQIMPLTANRTDLLAKINGLTAYGATAGALGTAWTWYMMSPKWNTVWTGEAAPGTYADLTALQANGKPKLRKVAILMTDGSYDAYRSWKGQDQKQVSDYAVGVCTAMKNAGIEIYTIGFDLQQLPTTPVINGKTPRDIATETLQKCATSTSAQDLSHFYQTINNNDLQLAFHNIGTSLTKLRITH